MGSAYNHQNKAQLAIEYYDKALSIDPNEMSSLIGKGIALNNLSKPEEALIYFEKSKLIDSKNPDVFWGLAIAYDAMGKADLAVDNAKKYIELVPNSKYRPRVEYFINKNLPGLRP